MGTLNLVGWLSGMLSLFRQLQQLPMVSEQPARPKGSIRDKKVKVSSHKPCAPEFAEPSHCDHSPCPRGCMTRSLPQESPTLHPGPDTHWTDMNWS